MIGGSVNEKEKCLDGLRDPDVDKLFFGWLRDLRKDYLESLVQTGDPSFRFKVQMIDEVLSFESDLYEEWKSEKQSA